MSSRVFEYFYEPEDLEPFYSRLPVAIVGKRNAQKVSRSPVPSQHSMATEATQESHFATRQTEDSGSQVVEQINHSKHKIETEIARPTDQQRTRFRRLISVHALGQYLFCRRSAILASETGDETDVDESLPRLTYLPNFDREKIEEMLSSKITQLGFFLFYELCLIGLMSIGLANHNRLVFYPSFVCVLGIAVWSLETLFSIVVLAARRRAAMRSEGSQPEPHYRKTESANWWSMLNAGFEPVRYERPFQHPELPLIGSPWRVLQRGSQRIPVIKAGGHQLGHGKESLYPKHEVRLVAYALLLEAASHIHVPYGLVFPVDSPRGLAFPITDELRERTQKMLWDLNQTLADSQTRGMHPELPGSPTRCANCDLGRPQSITELDVKNARSADEQLVVLKHHSGNLFRCQCADRFGSVPPHNVTRRLELTAPVG